MDKKTKKSNKTLGAALSTEYLQSSYTLVDNKFLKEYLPIAKPVDTQVYLYGLFNAVNATGKSMQDMASDLNMSTEDIMNSFAFWEDEGLVSLSRVLPYSVSFLSVKSPVSKDIRDILYDYSLLKNEFTAIPSHILKKFKFDEIQKLMDTTNIDLSAIKQIFSYAYLTRRMTSFTPMLRLAKTWATKAKTFEEVQKLITEDQSSFVLLMDVKRILFYEGDDINPNAQELDYYNKWIEMGFQENSILSTAKYIARKQNPSTFGLNSQLEELAKNKLFTNVEVNSYLIEKEANRELAIDINKILGNFEANLDAQVDTFIKKWNEYGYSENALKMIAKIAYTHLSIRTPQALSDFIDTEFKAKDLLSEDDIKGVEDYYKEMDEFAKRIISITGFFEFKHYDRENINFIKNQLHYGEDVIEMLAKYAKGKKYPISYIRKQLESFSERNIRTKEEIEKEINNPSNKNVKIKDIKAHSDIIKNESPKSGNVFIDLDKIEISKEINFDD